MTDVVFNTPITQYVVEVPGKGYFNPSMRIVTPTGDAAAIGELDMALKILKTVQVLYNSLGMGDVGETAHVVQREVKLIHTDWVPLTDSTP